MVWAATGTFAAIITLVITLQSFWIGRSFDNVFRALDRVDDRLDRIENNVLRDYGERIARLEAAQ
jgi:hypothetical protein